MRAYERSNWTRNKQGGIGDWNLKYGATQILKTFAHFGWLLKLFLNLYKYLFQTKSNAGCFADNFVFVR